ncbi:hypothetical protein, partial [Eudoraea sp.]|uniref:hypothetical protein n=1 Tax=Eudoraea sp. TaxID=1979955 RepID=UPI003C78B900
MKNIIALVSFCLCNIVTSQIKIGDNPQNIDPTSVLELESSNRVLVITRINSNQMNAIVPSAGALVYNTDVGCVFFYDGTTWLNLCETFGLSFSADPLVNPIPTIIITEDGNNRNFEVGEITGNNIVDFSISSIDIQNNSITAEKLAPDSVGSEELQDNTVGDDEIDYNVVTLNDFTNDAGYIIGADIVSQDPNNNITDVNGAFYDDTSLQNNIANNTAAIAADGDTDSTNEIQSLSLTGDNLSIAGSNTVDLSVFNDPGSDDQQLTLTGNTLGIEDGNTVDLSILNNPGTDEQDLTGATLSGANILQIDIENGASTTVDLSPLSGTGTDEQDLTGATLSPTNILQIDIENGASTSVDLSPLSGTGTDEQDLTGATLSPTNILQIDIENGASTTVDLSPLSGTGSDNQNLTGATLSPANILQIDIEDGTSATVDLSTLSGIGTDNQNLTGATLSPTNILQIDIEDGTSATVDLSALAAAGTDNQEAFEVPFTPTGNTLSVEVQSAIEELQTEIDGISAGGAANPTDELQNLQLNNTELSLTPPAAPNIPIDLDPVFATDAELAALNVNDADADPVNEIQTISILGTDLTLSNGGGTIAIPSTADGVVSNVTALGTSLNITGANGGFNGNIDLEPLVDTAVANNGYLTAEVDG